MKNYLIITGGSSGIGKATLELFLAQHWNVINISRTPCEITQVKNVKIDLASVSAIEMQAEYLKSLLPLADKICLVHNAAQILLDNVQTLAVDNLRHLFDINVVAATLLNQILIPVMPVDSSIIYIGSTLSEKAVANSASYSITKHAVAGLMKATCQDLFATGIHTCCICPGFTDTPMLQDVMCNRDLQQILKDMVSAQRLVEPKEIADLIYFCAMQPVINGAMLAANLGQTSH